MQSGTSGSEDIRRSVAGAAATHAGPDDLGPISPERSARWHSAPAPASRALESSGMSLPVDRPCVAAAGVEGSGPERQPAWRIGRGPRRSVDDRVALLPEELGDV